MNYEKTLNLIRLRRQNDLIAASAAYSKALDDDEKLAALDSAYRVAVLSDLKSGSSDKGEQAKRAINEYIKKIGKTQTFYPAPHCAACGDTGFVQGRLCDCVKNEAFKDSVCFEVHDFGQIDYSLFDQKDGERFRKVASDLKTVFEDKFPFSKKKIFSLLGKSGTGKTYLASCCVGAVLKKGMSATFVTAFRFVSDVAAYHTTFTPDREALIRPYLDCDLLAIDDLGTEAVYKNVTLEYLYLVVNERQLAGKHTLITSNLNIDQLAARYGERIASRILDKKTCYAVEFDGKDVRAHSVNKG